MRIPDLDEIPTHLQIRQYLHTGRVADKGDKEMNELKQLAGEAGLKAGDEGGEINGI